ncbi:hypothetical protein ElyMa_004551100 [Elysia marginata]|uniref:Secreted protein n=1 Tax=Elysia marginata TaxID=1093978 RepID=A0AAV4HQ82_9GAST|nr:hypothetical protein ElyMa_004551100 [Elysia marginata]
MYKSVNQSLIYFLCSAAVGPHQVLASLHLEDVQGRSHGIRSRHELWPYDGPTAYDQHSLQKDKTSLCQGGSDARCGHVETNGRMSLRRAPCAINDHQFVEMT